MRGVGSHCFGFKVFERRFLVEILKFLRKNLQIFASLNKSKKCS